MQLIYLAPQIGLFSTSQLIRDYTVLEMKRDMVHTLLVYGIDKFLNACHMYHLGGAFVSINYKYIKKEYLLSEFINRN